MKESYWKVALSWWFTGVAFGMIVMLLLVLTKVVVVTFS